MNEWQLSVAPEFGDDLRNIHSYISNELLEPIIAKDLPDKILKFVGNLKSFLMRYPFYEKEPWVSRGLRKMTVGNYLVFYLLKEAEHMVLMSSFAGEETSQVGKNFIKSFIGVCLEGAIIVLACIIYSKFATSSPAVDVSASAISQVGSYIGEIIFNMLVLVGTVKMSDQVVSKMMGL